MTEFKALNNAPGFLFRESAMGEGCLLNVRKKKGGAAEERNEDTINLPASPSTEGSGNRTRVHTLYSGKNN